MKKTLLTAGLSLLAASALYTVSAAGESDINKKRLNTIEIIDKYPNCSRAHVFNANTIDSIRFSLQSKIGYIYLYGSTPDSTKRFSVNDLISVNTTGNFISDFDGFNFTYLEPGQLATPGIYATLEGRNTVNLSWRPVEGSDSYMVRYIEDSKFDEGDYTWGNLPAFGHIYEVDGETTSFVIHDLPYDTKYAFTVRAMSREHGNSAYATRCDLQAGNMTLTTGSRYSVPTLLTGITDMTASSFTVNFDLTYDRDSYDPGVANDFESHFTIIDGKFKADKLRVKNLENGEIQTITLTPAQLAEGKVTLTGLTEFSRYELAMMDSSIPVEIDAVYDSMIVRVGNNPNLYDYISSLSDDYSIFRDMVMNGYEKIFAPALSKPLYENEKGDIVYDSVFIARNEHFDAVNFDMTSHNLTATLLLPSNDVINAALTEAHERLAKSDLERDDEALLRWIADLAFFDKTYTLEELAESETQDLYSVFNKQYRTSAQHLDGTSTRLHNAMVYPVSKLYIPNNVLIYRVKGNFSYYENCTDEQKSEYFKFTNLNFGNIQDDVPYWSPWPGVWPDVRNRCLITRPADLDKPFSIEHTPLLLSTDDAGSTSVKPLRLLPGAYRLAFGAVQNQNLEIKASVLIGGKVIAESDDIYLGSDNAYHYDRGSTLTNCYPEGYDVNYVRMMGGSTKAANYDTDGGLLIPEVVIPDINGDGSAVPVVLRIEGSEGYSTARFTLHHWCFRPTVNNY